MKAVTVDQLIRAEESVLNAAMAWNAAHTAASATAASQRLTDAVVNYEDTARTFVSQWTGSEKRRRAKR